MSTIQHEFMASSNPRANGRCACGRCRDEHPAPLTRPRDVEDERKITREAARGVGDPSALIAFSEWRITRHSREYVTNPMLVSMEHDKREMALEELSDCRNYIVWWLQEHRDHEDFASMVMALEALCNCYALARQRSED